MPHILEIWQTWDRGRGWVWGSWGHICPPCPTVPEQSRGKTPTTHSHGILSLPFKGTQCLEERVPAYTPPPVPRMLSLHQVTRGAGPWVPWD